MSKVENPLNLSLDCLYRPSRRSEKAPLLILLHGYGSNMHDLFSFAPYLNPDFAVSRFKPRYLWAGLVMLGIPFILISRKENGVTSNRHDMR